MSVGSVRSFQSANNSPRGPTTQFFNLTPPPSPRNMDTSTTAQPPVDPSEQQHFFNVPEPPKQSSNAKTKAIIQNSKFSKMTDTQIDENVEKQHEMNVDEAENQKQQKQTKSEKLQR
jgi:hypothetical protein